jgi:PPOX class probable F420-dependent enzyme
MTPAGQLVDPFLRTHGRAFLVTRRADGAPTVHPMGLIYREGTIFFNTYRRSAKVRNLQRDQRVSCLVASADDDPEFAAINVRGRAEVVDGSALPDSLLAGLPAGGPVMSEADLQRSRDRVTSGKRVYVRIVVDEARPCLPLAPRVGRRPEAGDPSGSSWEAAVVASPIAMSPVEVAHYLGTKEVAILGTLDAQGHPEAVAVRPVAGRGALHLAVPRSGGPPLDRLVASRVCATVEEFPTYDTIRGVMVHGPAHLTTDREWDAAADEVLPTDYVPITVDADRVISFDFRKITVR